MKPNALILVAVIVLAIAAAFVFQTISPVPQIHYAPKPTEGKNITGEDIPAFSIVRYGDDKLIKIPEDTKGKVVLLNFWASWCAPCVAEFPILISIAEEYRDNLVFLGVSSDIDVVSMEKFFKRIQFEPEQNEWMAHDARSKITSGLFQTYMLPETLLINQDGQLIKKYVGLDWTKEDMLADIAKLLE